MKCVVLGCKSPAVERDCLCASCIDEYGEAIDLAADAGIDLRRAGDVTGPNEDRAQSARMTRSCLNEYEKVWW